MSSPLDAVAALAGAVPGVASASAEVPHAVRVRLLPGADGADVALAVGRLLAGQEGRAERRTLTLSRAHRPGRARLERLDLHTDGASFHVGVALSCAGRSVSASARSGTTSAGSRRAVAEATLEAVGGLVAQPVHLEVEHVERSDTGAVPVALVQVSLAGVDGVQRLAGSAVVQDGEGDAFVRATLDAVNRRVEALLSPV